MGGRPSVKWLKQFGAAGIQTHDISVLLCTNDFPANVSGDHHYVHTITTIDSKSTYVHTYVRNEHRLCTLKYMCGICVEFSRSVESTVTKVDM